MGTYSSKNIPKCDPNKVWDEEPDYEIKTRSPKPSTWSMNIMRGKREDDLKNVAYSNARQKCHNKVHQFTNCEKQNGMFWTIFECQEEYDIMAKCFTFETDVEMDKLRRDIKSNNEWWWRDYYDEDGEIGEQAQWKGEWWLPELLRRQKKQILQYFK